jgi:Cu/Ag efflux pump CusA
VHLVLRDHAAQLDADDLALRAPGGFRRPRLGVETAIQGAADRLIPILMTSLVTGLGLLPLALGVGEPGREIEGPMAVVIVGGLATSMALNLLIRPTLALRYARFKIDQPDTKRESAMVS